MSNNTGNSNGNGSKFGMTLGDIVKVKDQFVLPQYRGKLAVVSTLLAEVKGVKSCEISWLHEQGVSVLPEGWLQVVAIADHNHNYANHDHYIELVRNYNRLVRMSEPFHQQQQPATALQLVANQHNS